MFTYVKSIIHKIQTRRKTKRLSQKYNYYAQLALRAYKISLIDLYGSSQSHRQKLILLKIKAGNIWSSKHFKTFFSRALKQHSNSQIKDIEALDYLDLGGLKKDFTVWAVVHFLR